MCVSYLKRKDIFWASFSEISSANITHQDIKTRIQYLCSVTMARRLIAFFQIARALPWPVDLQTDLPRWSRRKSVCRRLWGDRCPRPPAPTPASAPTSTPAWQPTTQWPSVPSFEPWHKFWSRSWLVRRPGRGQDYEPGPGSVPGPGWSSWDFKWRGGRAAHTAQRRRRWWPRAQGCRVGRGRVSSEQLKNENIARGKCCINSICIFAAVHSFQKLNNVFY